MAGPSHIIRPRHAIMNFHEQDRSGVVTLSAAKGLSRWAQRCFAALSMTFPVVVVKIHYLAPVVQYRRG